MARIWGTACLVIGLMIPWGAVGETIGAGNVRTVEGTLTAVDVAHRAVVLEVPTPKGDLTVGATLDESVTPRAGGKTVALSDLEIGKKARLKYTRQNGRLVGLALEVGR